MSPTPSPTPAVQEAEPTPTYSRLPMRVQVAGAIMVALGVVTAILMARDVSSASYLYLAFYSIPANTAISLFPHEPVLIYFGTLGAILPAALAATAGTIVAGLLDHTVFVPLLNHEKAMGYKKNNLYRRGIRYFQRWPFLTLVVTGFTPIPFWPFKVLSFSIHYPLWKYLGALVLARFPRYVLLAWIGTVFRIPNWLLIAVFLAMFSLYFIRFDSESKGQFGRDSAPGEGSD